MKKIEGSVLVRNNSWYKETNYGIYMDAVMYGTRDSKSCLLFTWNDVGADIKPDDYNVKIYLTDKYYSSVRCNGSIEFGEDNPFSSTMSPISTIDVTNIAAPGELCRYFIDSNRYYVMVAVQLLFHIDEVDMDNVYVMHMHSVDKPKIITKGARPNLLCDSTNKSISLTPESSGSFIDGLTVLEFHNVDDSINNNLSGIFDGLSVSNMEEVFNDFLLTTCINEELDGELDSIYKGYYDAYHGVDMYGYIYRWSPGRHPIKIQYGTGSSPRNENERKISAAIDSAISQINDILSPYNVSFYKGTTATNGITIRVDTEVALFGQSQIDSGYIYGGTWACAYDESAHYITTGLIKLANDFQDYAMFASYETTVLEELYQALGAGFDQMEYPFDTINTDFNYYNKCLSDDGTAVLYDRDVARLRLLYSKYVDKGDNYTDVSIALNIPKGCYIINKTNNIDVSFLPDMCEYEVRAFLVTSDGYVSPTSNWHTISFIPESPGIFEWDTEKVKGGEFNLTASEWNRLIAHLKLVCKHVGKDDEYYYVEDIVYPGDILTANKYKEIAQKINLLCYDSGYKWDQDWASAYDVKPGDHVTAYLINRLKNRLNELV